MKGLLTPGTLDYWWCRYLASRGNLDEVLRATRGLGRARWAVPARRKRALALFTGLQASARAAGLEGRLAQVEARLLARDHLLARPLLDVAPALISAAPEGLVSEILDIEGFQPLIDTLAAGRGLVLAGAHFGALGAAVALLVRQGYPVVILRDGQFRPLAGTRHGDQFFFGATPLFIDESNPETAQSALLAAARHLRRGAAVAYTADAGHGLRGREITVLGKKLSIRTGLAELAGRTGARVSANFGYATEGGLKSLMGEPREVQGARDLDAWLEDYAFMFQKLLLERPESVMDYETAWTLAGAT